jgi:hypothetical protein
MWSLRVGKIKMKMNSQRGEQFQSPQAIDVRSAPRPRPIRHLASNLQFSDRHIPLVESGLTYSKQRPENFLIVTHSTFLTFPQKSASRKWIPSHAHN